MDIDERFPTKLQSVQDLPQPFRSALANSVSHPESIRQLIHAPAFSTAGEKTPAAVLAVTDKGWLVASETEDGGAHVEKSDFCETLFIGRRPTDRANLEIITGRIEADSEQSKVFAAVRDQDGRAKQHVQAITRQRGRGPETKGIRSWPPKRWA